MKLIKKLNRSHIAALIVASLVASPVFAAPKAAPKAAQPAKKTAAKATPTPTPTATPTPGPTPKGIDGLFSLGSQNKNEPIFISANLLTVYQAQREFEYSGNVEVKQGDMTLTAATLHGSYNETNQIDVLTAKTGVVITKGPNIKASGEKAEYSRILDTVTLTQNPKLEQEGSELTADKVTVHLTDNRSEAEGNVHVKMVKKADSKSGSLSTLLGGG